MMWSTRGRSWVVTASLSLSFLQVPEICAQSLTAVQTAVLVGNGAVERVPSRDEVLLEASRDAVEAKLSLSYGHAGSRMGSYSIAVATAVEKGDPVTELVTLAGLVDDVSVTAAWRASRSKLSVGLDLGAGYSSRDYFDPSGDPHEDDRPSFVAEVKGSRVFSRAAFIARLAYLRGYEEHEAAQRCVGLDGAAGLERCRSLPVGRPSEVESLPVALEYRVQVHHWWAASPVVAYDLERDRWAGSLAIYLARNAAGAFTGGLRVDLEEGRDPLVSVFVGAPLDLP